jgi:transposase
MRSERNSYALNNRDTPLDEGGQNLAILLTIVTTCVLHGVEPSRYLTDVIVRVNEPGVTIEDLLPWNWKPAA